MAYFSRVPEFEPDMSPTEIRVTHACYFNGEPRKVGAVLVVPRVDAAYGVGLKRCEIIRKLENAE